MTHPLPADHYVLRLYVTGSAPHSVRAIHNVRLLCAKHLAGRHDLEVIDIYQRPNASVDGQIIAAPTLVRLHPEPVRRIIGDLSDATKVLSALSIVPERVLDKP